MIARLLNKPYYIFRPTQAFRRLALLLGRDPRNVVLPWGLPIRFDRSEAVGDAIARIGLYDLTVCEALWRLADPGDLAVDAGANIGVMTSVLAVSVGKTGEVVALEPHPRTFERLAANVAHWHDASTITPARKALSDQLGIATLHLPADAATATLSANGPAVAEVECTTLDELLGERRVGVLKLDVEGHEEAVLVGARRALVDRRVRDIVFEDLAPPPTAVMRLLEEAGYSLFKLDCRLLRLALIGIDGPFRHRVFESPNYLATLDPGRARSRIGSWGWQVLRRR